MKHPYAEIELQISRTIDYLSAVTDAKSDADYGALYLQILHALETQMKKQNPYALPSDQIVSSQVMLHVADARTGHVYCRKLPLDYQENNNGILLTGENISGQKAEIAFLSNTAIDKIHELIGRGADHSPCDND